jgi:hypothetical protein
MDNVVHNKTWGGGGRGGGPAAMSAGALLGFRSPQRQVHESCNSWKSVGLLRSLAFLHGLGRLNSVMLHQVHLKSVNQNVAALQAATCSDKVKNGDEADVDCGGASCGKCADTKQCSAPSDCESGVCTSGVCQV